MKKLITLLLFSSLFTGFVSTKQVPVRTYAKDDLTLRIFNWEDYIAEAE